MFETVKKNVNLLSELEKDLNVPFKESGSNFVIEDEREYGGCPFCDHKDCFKVKHDPENLEESFYKCFSCDAMGSVIDWTAHHHGLSVREAAIKLAKDNNLQLPKDYSPIQEIFEIAAGYYANCLAETSNIPQIRLAKMTPMDYQINVRSHKKETIENMKVGWSDGKLVEFLEGIGFDPELLLESGLKNKKHGGDFLPDQCFIYPHYVRNRVSHFTFKDPIKKAQYQLPNKYVLNGYEFYNQDCIKNFETVIIVEGENDLLSVKEHTSKYGVIATIGSISGDQLDWMREHLADKHVVTLFDPDDAGDKYRIKVQKIKSSFKSLTQVKPSDEKDIDEHLTRGGDLDSIILNNKVIPEIPASANGKSYEPPPGLTASESEVSETGTDIESEAAKGNSSIVEKHGCYWKVRYKDGEPIYTKISNFLIELKNVYLTEDGDRLREIVVIREDGYVSDPVLTNSEVKVSLRSFRTLLARAADADFRGNDSDLILTWDLIYSKGTETLVKVTRVVGRNERSKGWIFRNKYISDSGAIIDPDEFGIFWLNGKAMGMKAESLNKTGQSNEYDDIPKLETETSSEDREELLKGFTQNLAKNLGDIGAALLLVGWMNGNAYSNSIFNLNKSYPMLFVWGSNGEGKGTICSWLMEMYNLADTGKTAVSQLKSGVGFGRKAEYYASLPLWVDEIRADKDTAEYNSTFRSYYDRISRTMGAKDGFGVKIQDIRSCFMFAGEDQFEDPATKERCITVRIPKINREKNESYQWIEGHKSELSSIGYKWILESVNESHKAMLGEIKALDKELIIKAGCSSRKSKNWAVVGLFALRLAKRFFPDFDMKEYLYKASTLDTESQKSETTVAQFFETVESIKSQEGIPKITASHILCDGDHLHIWYPHVYRVVQDAGSGRFPFSKAAVLAQLREEPYFVSDSKKITMGLNGVRRLVVTLDLTKAPDVIKNIAQMNVE